MKRRKMSDFNIDVENVEANLSFDTSSDIELVATSEEEPTVFQATIENLNSDFSLNLEDNNDSLATNLQEGYPSTDVIDYGNLTHKPSIEGVTLIGNKTLEDLGISKIEVKTTAEWRELIDYIPLVNTILVFSDYEHDNEGKPIPNFKVADGLAYAVDLPFIDDGLRKIIIEHINDNIAHTTIEEKIFWNNKVNIDDEYEEVSEETLVFNRR